MACSEATLYEGLKFFSLFILVPLDSSHSHSVFDTVDSGPNGLGGSGGNMIHFLDMEQASSIKCRKADA